MRDTPPSPSSSDARQRMPFATPPFGVVEPASSQHIAPPEAPEQSGASARRGRGERRRTPWFVWLIGGCLGVIALLTLGIALIAGLIGGLFFKLSQEPTIIAQTTSTYVVSGAPTVTVQNSVGSITFQAGASDQVVVNVVKRARDATHESAQQDIQQIQITIQQQGNTVSVQAHFIGSGGGALGAQRSVDMTITLPTQANIQASIGAGDITASGVSGSIQMNNGAGTLTLNQVTLGNGSQLTDTAGTITVSGALASGASASIHDSAGDINVMLPATTATIINARASAGQITVHGWNLTFSRSGYGAGARAIGQTAPNARGVLSLQTDAGNITLTAGE